MITMATHAILTQIATVPLHQPIRTKHAAPAALLTNSINARAATIAIRTHLTHTILIILITVELMEVESPLLFRPFYA